MSLFLSLCVWFASLRACFVSRFSLSGVSVFTLCLCVFVLHVFVVVLGLFVFVLSLGGGFA